MMFAPRIRTAGLAIAAALGLAACTDGYGYSGVSLGYGSAGYYDPYYDGGYYGSYGSPSYYGWYDGFYYPGTGYYVYDRARRPVRWSSAQRRYWESRRGSWRGERRDNWRDFRRDGDRRGEWRGRQPRPDRPVPGIRVDERGDRRPVYRRDGRPDLRTRPGVARPRPDGAPRARPDRPRPDGAPRVRPERPRAEGARPRGEWRNSNASRGEGRARDRRPRSD